jgi:hypothetical protein
MIFAAVFGVPELSSRLTFLAMHETAKNGFGKDWESWLKRA